jgi:hypothetical protein
MAPNVNITGEELLRARRKKGVSVDKYADARELLGFNIRNALIVGAAKPSITIGTISKCLELGLRTGEVVGLIITKRDLNYIIDLMGRGSATANEAIAAWDVGMSVIGSVGYIALHVGRRITHQAIVDACFTARNADVKRDIFMAYLFLVKLDEAPAIEIARTGLEPAIYVAAIDQGFAHQVIVDRCDIWQHEEQFTQQIERTANQQDPNAMKSIRHQLYSTRK